MVTTTFFYDGKLATPDAIAELNADFVEMYNDTSDWVYRCAVLFDMSLDIMKYGTDENKQDMRHFALDHDKDWCAETNSWIPLE